jgi:hypothetical protein
MLNDDSNDNKKYELSQSLVSDGESVRALACTNTNTSSSSSTGTDCHLMSGSEGGILASISLNGNDNDTPTATVSIQPGGEGTRHGHQITALLASSSASSIAADADANGSSNSNSNNSIYVTGCKDKLIRIFNSSTHALLHTLEGHDNAVTSLSWLPCDEYEREMGGWILISGSWDGTAKLWYIPHMIITISASGSGSSSNLCRCIATLPGHENTFLSWDYHVIRPIQTLQDWQREVQELHREMSFPSTKFVSGKLHLLPAVVVVQLKLHQHQFS